MPYIFLLDSGGIKFGRDISQIYNSWGCKFWWNYFIPELALECSPECTGTEWTGIRSLDYLLILIRIIIVIDVCYSSTSANANTRFGRDQ